MAYDPRAHGALCHLCPLEGCSVVPPESNSGADIAVVGEAPGEQEEKIGRPFVGPSGAEFDRAIRAAGARRNDFHITNALCCRPPDNDLKKLNTKISRYNKKELEDAKAEGREPNLLAFPVECCAPRLAGEIARFDKFITLGGVATAAVTGNHGSILALRGGLQELSRRTKAAREAFEAAVPEANSLLSKKAWMDAFDQWQKDNGYMMTVMPSVHPAFVLRQQRWAHVFRNDLAKAIRAFKGVRGWAPPNVTYNPPPSVLADFLSDKDRVYTFDIEADGIESLTAHIRCIAIGDEKDVMVVGFRSNTRPRDQEGLFLDFYSDIDAFHINAILTSFFTDKGIVKVGHNAGSYDKLVLRSQMGIEPEPILDTILLHRNVESELPHSLAYIASLYTDAPAWKCYDSTTEVLTPRGWVPFPDLSRDDLVAQWDNGQVSFVPPHAYVNQEYKGKMWHLHDQATDLLVTPDHKMIYRPAYNPKTSRPESFGLLRSCEVQNMPKTGHLPHTGQLRLSAKRGPDEPEFVRLIVAFQADGTWAFRNKEDRRNGSPSYLDFGFSRERKIERLKEILDSLGLSYTEKATGSVNPRTRIWVRDSPVIDRLYALLGPEKTFGPWLLQWSAAEREVFLSELPLWDGTQSKDHNNYNTVQAINADWVQACAVVTGRSARLSQYAGRTSTSQAINRVSLPNGNIRSREWSGLFQLCREQVDYNGQIYCVSVPSGFLLVRRNGKVTVSGNTDRDNHKLALGGETDLELHEYCAKDVSITASCFQPLLEQVKLRDQVGVWKSDQRMQLICADMHMVGMYVDQKKRLAEEKKLLALRHTLLEEIRRRTGLKDFNPGSIYHMRDLLFKRWGLESHLAATDLKEEDLETSSGDLSTGDLILRTILTLRTVPEDRRETVKLIRRYRKVMKILGTYVVKLRPWNMGADLGWDEDDDWVTTEMRKKYGEVKTGIVDPVTGRMHPGYNPQVAVTGRLSSSKPINCFDGETEILTEGGWVRFEDLQEGVAVAQWHSDGSIDFAKPTAYHQGVHQGSMIRFCNQSADLLMTPNHRLPLLKNSGRAVDVLAEDLMLLGAGYHTRHAGMYVGGDGVELSDDEIRFLVAVHADAHLAHQGGKTVLDIVLARPRKIERLERLLKSLNLSYEKKDRKPGRLARLKPVRFVVPVSERLSDCLDYILPTGVWSQRVWGPWLLQMNRKQINVFVEEIWNWDSCYERQSMYACQTKGSTDWVQILLVLSGIRTNTRLYTNKHGNQVWIDDVRRTKTNAITHKAIRERVDWNDKVYCVTVPSDAIIVRRNGKVTITRQSQNFPVSQRGMVVAQPGHVLVGADMDQLELRIAAALWNVDLYLRAFREGKDPHSMTAYAVFGDAFCKAAGLSPEAFQKPGVLVGAAYDEHGVFQKGVSKDAKSMRDLSKAVQYASISKEEEVAVLDDRGSIPICRVQRGDWVWAWSNKENRYEPTRVKKAWSHGNKECVKVTFCWGKGGSYTGSVVVTSDHPMLMRNGVLRHAGSLQANDRLMPFYRREIEAVRPANTVYRHVQPRNDGTFVGEHRVVRGFYEAGESKTHIHHKNKNTRDNRPPNLEVLDHLDHYQEHKVALDAGRVNSPAWRAAVANPETRSAASKKSWEGRRERQDTDRTFGPRGSVLDTVKDQIGVKTDAEVAAMVGCTQELVGMYRKSNSIAPPVGQKGWLRWLLTNDVLWNRLLHDNTDVEMARLVGEHFGVEATRDAVHQTRKLLGIPAVKKNRAAVYPRRASKLDSFADRVGHEKDSVIAKEAGCTPEAVGMYRKKHGIPAYWKEAPGGNNHTVVSIEPAGVHEVWDIEVEHEDHNFALAAGIFVHNSQYMASVETVHQLIQKTELPATDPNTGKALDDGTTDLPYAKLPLKRVREMRDAWLKGAPEFEGGWNREIDEFRRLGYLRDPVAGRRRDFLDGEEPNQIVNFKIQGAAAGLMNDAIIKIHEEIPAHKWGPGTGIINQCHDSIAIECPESEAEKVAKLMEECMNQEHPALPGVKFSASAVIGKSWKDV